MAVTADDLKVLSGHNLRSRKKLNALLDRGRQIARLQEAFERLRLLGDEVQGDPAEELAVILKIKAGLQQFDLAVDGDPDASGEAALSLAELIGAVNGEIAQIRTPDTPEFLAAAAVLATTLPEEG